MKFHLEPVNHDKISDLCGPTNSILKQIEEELGIKILNRGASFRIKGEFCSIALKKTSSYLVKFPYKSRMVRKETLIAVALSNSQNICLLIIGAIIRICSASAT